MLVSRNSWIRVLPSSCDENPAPHLGYEAVNQCTTIRICPPKILSARVPGLGGVSQTMILRLRHAK